MADLTQRIVWTLLPNGFDASSGALRASVLVSPRLTLSGANTPPDLHWFGDWKDWPTVIRNSVFEISVDGGPFKTVKRTAKAEVQPESEIWTALFPGSTYVKPFVFADMRGKVILSYPVAGIAKGVEAIYGRLGAGAGADLPTRDALLQAIGGRGERMRPDQVLSALRAEAKASIPVRSQSSNPIRQPKAALDLLTTYHTPLEQEIHQSYTKQDAKDPRESATWLSRKRADLPKPGDFRRKVDFHQIVASLAQYQDLSRRAGLVVWLDIDRSLVPDGVHTLQLRVTWPKSGGPVKTLDDIVPPVMVHRQGTVFEPAPRSPSSPITGRFLKLQESGFDLVQMDVDGAALKLKNLATNLVRSQPAEYDDESFKPEDQQPHRAGAPSLRTSGLMLAQDRRDLAIQALFTGSGQRQDKVDQNPPQAQDPLYAEDVIRGYRVDVRDETTKVWRTLCSRRIDFTLVNTGRPHTTEREEGMARLAAASSADGSNPDILKIHEGLFAWKGWSLSAPEPGQVIQPDESIGAENDAPPPGLPLRTRFTPSGKSLPQLRFGRAYTVRVRLVDLAGESEPFSDQDIQPQAAVSNTVVYRRHEPIEAPALALVKGGGGVELPADGESMGRLAIRTFNDDPSKNTVPIKDVARRHLVPPRSTHRFAEQHGVMDNAQGHIDRDLWGTLQSLDRPLDEEVVTRPSPKPGQPPVQVTFAVAPEHFDLPFLPDPLALGVAIKVEGAAGVDPNVIHKVPFYGDIFDPLATPKWPGAQPFTIVAAEANLPDAKFFGGSRREFVVPLRKAEKAKVRISCLIPRKAWTMMAISQMIADQKPGAARLAELAQLADDGQHWMFTPWRTIELVHAVQKPLITPDLNPLMIQRKLNSIAATPVYRTRLHAKSTGKIDLFGAWDEPLDDPTLDETKAGPVVRHHKAHAYETHIARNEAPGDFYSSPGQEHVFGDTRYRRISYGLDATTRYREFLPEKYRKDDKALKVSSTPKRTWVPNSAPPPPPKLLYVAPTFGWTRQASGAQTTSLRAGGGLRVYLDRPWFTTGFCEMLGVVLPPAAPSIPTLAGVGQTAMVDGAYRPYVTQWGSDPIWVSGRIRSAAPPNSAFPLAKWRAPIPFDGTSFPDIEGSDLPAGDFPVANLAHPQLSQGLNVAPHPVGYDAERGLWYADIVIRPPGNAYFPFVRLALARYHPVSVDGAHLSGIVLTEFQQLAPDRLAIVTHVPNGLKAHVAIYGAAALESSQGLPETGIFDIDTQVLDAGADPDAGWRSVAGPNLPPPGSGKPSFMPQAYAQAPPPPSTAAQAQAQQYLDTENFHALLGRPDLIQALRPPLLWEDDVTLPATPPGGRRRLVITESERYQTSPETVGLPSGPSGSIPTVTRIVYLETLDV